MTTRRNTAMLQVKEAGFYTTIQDQGRFGYRHLGVPVSGAADQIAAGRVNGLLENPESAAVLEMTMQGPVLEFAEPTFICYSGAPMEIRLNGQTLDPDQVYAVPGGAVLQCGRILHGFRSYLGIKGGFLAPLVLGSRSYYSPVTKERKIKPGDEIAYTPCTDYAPMILKWSHADHIRERELRSYPGPEYDLLSQKQRELLFTQEFSLAKEHDRMACQLTELLPAHTISMITSATLPGTVQLAPSGKLIILLRDGQTTGGYPRILQLEENAQSILAQKKSGDKIRFRTTGY